MYVHDGLSVVLVFPSPKLQLHDIAFVEVSVKVTVTGAVPDVGEAEKEAIGAVM